MKEGGALGQKFSPVFYLTDLITAYLAVAGVMSALLKRAIDGGSYHVKVTLSRSAMWVQNLGYIQPEKFMQAPEQDDYPINLFTEESPYGKITRLSPPTKFSHMPSIQMKPVVPYGSQDPAW